MTQLELLSTFQNKIINGHLYVRNRFQIPKWENGQNSKQKCPISHSDPSMTPGQKYLSLVSALATTLVEFLI
jgi:hypothetical protein